MCLGAYTCYPLPAAEWDADLQPVSRAFLPAVGLLMGLLWWALAGLASWLLPPLLGGALLAVFPLVATGFLHLNGFARCGGTLLARAADQNLTREQLCALLPALMLIFQFAACASLDRIFPLVWIPVISRACWAVGAFAPKAPADGEAEEEDKAVRTLLLIEKCVIAGALVLLLVFSCLSGLLAGAAVLGAYALCKHLCKGMDSEGEDSAAFALTVSELCGLIVLAIL